MLLRKVEKKVEDDWVQCGMKDLQVGDIFRMFDPETNNPVKDGAGNTEWVTTGDPYVMTNEHGVETWGVMVNSL